MSVYEFYDRFLVYYYRATHRLDIRPRSRALPPAPYPDWFCEYFLERGISLEMVEEAGAVPLTERPTSQEKTWYEQHRKSARVNSKGEPYPTERGIGWTYPVDVEKFGKFGRERILYACAHFLTYYQEKDEKPPKCLSPSEKKIFQEAKQKNLTPATSHLYILQREFEKLKKPDAIPLIIEGEAKTLALAQDARTLEDALHRYAVIGLSGVDQLINTPEAKAASWKNRLVYLLFDADSGRKPTVARAEIKAAAYFISRGARQVLSCSWREKEGNGYDDMQVRTVNDGFSRSAKLQQLLDKAVPTFRKYAPTEKADGLPLKTFCEAVGKVPDLGSYKPQLVNDLHKLFKFQSYTQKDVKDLLDQEIDNAQQEERQQEKDEQAKKIQALFGINYTPQLPANFRPQSGKLWYDNTPLCNMFVIRKYIATDDADRQDYYLLKFAKGNKEIEIPSDDFSRCQNIAKIFNRNREILHDASSKKVQQFISQYWGMNEEQITITRKYFNTGWTKDGFQMPTVNADCEFEHKIKEAITTEGHADIQETYLAEWFREGHRGMLQVIGGLATPWLSLLKLQNMTIMVSGDPGGGKTTGYNVANSIYGKWQELKFTMNTTNTGQEIVGAMFKDLPVLMDETNTGGKDGAGIAQQVLETIYGWESGKGRARGTTNITLRKVNEYNGILLLTSERSLATILSVTKNMNVGGAYRRVLEIPANEPLWKFTPEEEKPFFNEIYDKINAHYGHFGARWIRHISDEHVQHVVIRRYKEKLAELGKKYSMKGADNLVALMYAIIPELETLLGLADGTILEQLGDFFETVIQHNLSQVEYFIKDNKQRFLDALEDFMSEHLACFDGLAPKDTMIAKIYGKYDGPVSIDGKPPENPDGPFDVWLRPDALEKICNAHGFNKQGVLEQLAHDGILQHKIKTVTGKDGSTKQKPEYLVNKWICNRVNLKTHHLKINYPPEPEPKPVQQDAFRDDRPLDPDSRTYASPHRY